ncbi:hypothetical protein [Comamonas terrigena]|uniref:hypothetical protein n=1 Tax=Comamonas terrigena TaxID=32013 RepID=UPI0028A10706|nr:hypothetical protein [Comamonas terrigena]
MAGLHGSLSRFLAVIVGRRAFVRTAAAYAIAAVFWRTFTWELALLKYLLLLFLMASDFSAAALQIEEMRGYFSSLGKIKAVK